MKKFSDYKGEAAIDLWADLLEPLTNIFGDEEIRKVVKTNGPVIVKAKAILKTHKKDAVDMLMRIDPTPIDGLNVIARLVELFGEIQSSEYFADFFGSSAPETTERESFGSVTENIAAGEN